MGWPWADGGPPTRHLGPGRLRQEHELRGKILSETKQQTMGNLSLWYSEQFPSMWHGWSLLETLGRLYNLTWLKLPVNGSIPPSHIALVGGTIQAGETQANTLSKAFFIFDQSHGPC